MISTKQQLYFDKWQLGKPNKTLETHSSFLYWCAQDNLAVVLKIYKSHSDEAAAANLLRHYDGCGAVKVLAHDEDACLLEQVGNGRELVEFSRVGDDVKAAEILCQVIGKLHSAPAIDIGLRPVDEFVVDFEEYLARDFCVERDLVERARRVYTDLSASQGNRLNLHGDLHHYNIMRAGDGGWVAIDPKGYWGEAEYELGAFLRNPLAGDFVGIDMGGRFDIIDAQLDYDMERVKKWAFCQAVLASVWADDDMVFARRMVGVF
ncbi:MAG: hypothetical protein COB24_12775 [Hyphomicrobiales bacterium]|nr:MAG: hypothetical protein COB24_12775 [Hyphomicrobiales bacterium]